MAGRERYALQAKVDLPQFLGCLPQHGFHCLRLSKSPLDDHPPHSMESAFSLESSLTRDMRLLFNKLKPKVACDT